MIAALVVASLWLDAGALATDPDPASSPPASDASGTDGADRAPPTAESSVVPLVERAAQQYDQGLLDDALATLEQAQRLSPSPAIFYNIAQIQRRRGDCAAALTAYNRYLEKAGPTDPKRDRATRWAAEMQACVDRNVAAHAGPPTTDGAPALPERAPIPKATGATATVTASNLGLTPPPVAPPVPGVDLTASAPGKANHRRARIAGWSLVAAGGLCEVAAIVLQIEASQIQSELDNGAITDSNQSNRISQKSRGTSYAHWALGTAIAGGALVAGGTWVLIVNRQTDPGAPPTSVLAVAGTF